MRKWLIILATLWLATWSTPAGAESSPLDKARFPKVQAAYVLNFAKFITWPPPSPAQSHHTFIIGIFGAAPGETLLQPLHNKTAQGEKIEIRTYTSSKDTEQCHILFINQATGKDTAELLNHLHGKPVVTISTLPNFARDGGTIELFQQGENILFSINLSTAKQSGLSIPSQVLALAVEVLVAKQ